MAKQLQTLSDKFDECVAELSPEAQEYFETVIPYIVKQLANGGGTMSAKELIWQTARFLNLSENYGGTNGRTRKESDLPNMPSNINESV